MENNLPFTIYNASAGSGKTYTLVKEYLKILLASNNQYIFKNILAITFTNKAVAEMKERIIETLKEFSDPSVLKNSNSMFETICEELNIKPEKLHEKSEKLLNTILHNYAGFDISTIDGFTHKLIRTFAHDLKLPLNFEVELDQDSLLNEAVDSLINKAGRDADLTKVLVDFAIEKADDDKSWDVGFDFNKIAKLLVKENEIPFIETLKDKTLVDFKKLKSQVRKDIILSEKSIVEFSKSVLSFIKSSGLEFSDFSRSTLPNHFKKASELKLEGLYNNQLETNISERKSIYTATLDPDKKNKIDSILPKIEVLYKQTKQAVFQYKFLKGVYKNTTPLSVLNIINNELNALKLDQNKMLISEFNSIISKEIKDQPTPFIYERIGEKFNHYFIDEFQDTSTNQWDNLIPLLENALSKEAGSVMLVGDAKQAIYRWRGGKAEQFINLFNKTSTPFPIEQQVENLPKNFRSFKEIVSFNNGFFKYLSDQIFSNLDYKVLYENAQQDITKDKNGYVELTFLNTKDNDRNELFSSQVLNTVEKCLKNGYELSDICVLVRKKKEGVAVAQYLSEQNIPIISSETLLLSNAPEVNFVNNVLSFLVQPKNDEVKIAVLNYLTSLFDIEDKHTFFTNHIGLSVSELFKSLEAHQVYINSENLLQLPIYDLAETILRSFNLLKTSNAYIQFYLDVVLDFSQKKGSDVSEFLSYFDKKKDTLSIVSPVGQKAIQIMTIHKSKGLEFPIVIFPYADLDMYREIEPTEWFPLDEKNYNGFPHTLLNYNKNFENYGDDGKKIYQKHQSELELDAINLLYVVLTRAVEQLYIISKNDNELKEPAKLKKYSGLLINYLKHFGVWDDATSEYAFGNPKKTTQRKPSSVQTSVQNEFISTSKDAHNIQVVTKSGFLWDTNQKDAIEKGNLIHKIMSQIETENDIDIIIEQFINNSTINSDQAIELKQTILQIVIQPKLIKYYQPGNTVYNERDIITKKGMVYRPDRVVVNSNNEAVIIDYKTGAEDKKHTLQLKLYEEILEDMNFRIKEKILVYINDNIKVKLV